MSEQWVVTFSMDYRDGFSTVEFFRGEKAECLRIAESFGGFGDDDRRRLKPNPWRVTIGEAEDWDDFLADMEN